MREVAVSVNGGEGKIALELVQEQNQCVLLRYRARVFRSFAICGQTANIANTYTVGIMPDTMRSDLLDGSTHMDGTVTIDYVVIPYGLKATLLVPIGDVSDREVSAFRRGRAMDNDFIDSSHA